MKRRKFLAFAGIGGVITAFSSAKFITTYYEQAAINIINRELHYLKLDQDGLRKFVYEFGERNKKLNYRYAVRLYSMLGISANQSGKLHRLVTIYLLSTDFFMNKMDETRELKYIGLYDPYQRPCQHPFSHIQYPSETTNV